MYWMDTGNVSRQRTVARLSSDELVNYGMNLAMWRLWELDRGKAWLSVTSGLGRCGDVMDRSRRARIWHSSIVVNARKNQRIIRYRLSGLCWIITSMS